MSQGRARAAVPGPAVFLSLLLAVAIPACRQDDPAALEAAARASYAAGRLEQAEDRLARLARLRPLMVRERVLRAQIAQERGLLDDALAALNDPEGEEPTQEAEAALLSAWRGWIEMDRHRFRAAETHLKRAVSLQPRRAQARRQLIDLYALQNRPADLHEQARALARLETLDFAYLFAWTLGQREGTDLHGQTAMLQDAVAADPDDRASRLALADCLRRLGKLPQADETLAPLPEADPQARLIRARLALDRGDAAAAEALVGPPETARTHPELAQLRGHLALLRGDAAAALDAFQEAARTLPQSRDVQFGLGQALRLSGQAEAAAPHLKAARERDRLEWLVRGARGADRRTDPAILQQIGAACLAVGRRNLAEGWYRLALSHAPNDPTIQAALAGLKAEGADSISEP